MGRTEGTRWLEESLRRLELGPVPPKRNRGPVAGGGRRHGVLLHYLEVLLLNIPIMETYHSLLSQCRTEIHCARMYQQRGKVALILTVKQSSVTSFVTEHAFNKYALVFTSTSGPDFYSTSSTSLANPRKHPNTGQESAKGNTIFTATHTRGRSLCELQRAGAKDGHNSAHSRTGEQKYGQPGLVQRYHHLRRQQWRTHHPAEAKTVMYATVVMTAAQGVGPAAERCVATGVHRLGAILLETPTT